mmetsp:Transcript_120393/g.269103  ORF Transcript_120393/g.269103 Transcript_120393/m.269103 type:complete len:212 (-) Transcript_120393:74-709(-)
MLAFAISSNALENSHRISRHLQLCGEGGILSPQLITGYPLLGLGRIGLLAEESRIPQRATKLPKLLPNSLQVPRQLGELRMIRRVRLRHIFPVSGLHAKLLHLIPKIPPACSNFAGCPCLQARKGNPRGGLLQAEAGELRELRSDLGVLLLHPAKPAADLLQDLFQASQAGVQLCTRHEVGPRTRSCNGLCGGGRGGSCSGGFRLRGHAPW